MSSYSVITKDFVEIIITNSGENSQVERRYPKHLTIADFKGKLELVTGGNSSTMRLQLFNLQDKLVCELDNNEALLGSYPIDDGFRIHVIDSFVLKQQLEDSNVEKFELSEEEYAKRQDTLKHFLQSKKIGKYNEEEMKQREQKRLEDLKEEEDLAKACQIGSRCEVRLPNKPTRRGTVMYVGELDGKPGWFVGVKYDEPLGVNDGSFNGKRYFECSLKYGGFVKPTSVICGDFPEVDDFADEL